MPLKILSSDCRRRLGVCTKTTMQQLTCLSPIESFLALGLCRLYSPGRAMYSSCKAPSSELILTDVPNLSFFYDYTDSWIASSPQNLGDNGVAWIAPLLIASTFILSIGWGLLGYWTTLDDQRTPGRWIACIGYGIISIVIVCLLVNMISILRRIKSLTIRSKRVSILYSIPLFPGWITQISKR